LDGRKHACSYLERGEVRGEKDDAMSAGQGRAEILAAIDFDNPREPLR
jgi:hypothetical protein